MKNKLKLTELRESKKLDIYELAQELGVTRQTLSSWENVKSSSFAKGNNLTVLCNYFGVEEDYFDQEDISSQVIEELKSTIDYLKNSFDVLKDQLRVSNEEKAELMVMLKLALQHGNGPKGKGSAYPSLKKVEESNSESAVLKVA